MAWVVAAFAATQAGAQTAQRIYELNGSYAETNGGSAMVPSGGTLGATGYTFAASQGPGVSNALANTGEYSIELLFRINETSSYRNLINFNGLTDDVALYCLNGRVSFYPYSAASATTDLVVGQTHRLVVTRNASTKVTTAYVDGAQKLQVTDSNNYYVASAANGILYFFHDDGGEDTSGFLDSVRIYHSVLTPAQVAALGQTSPATGPEIQVKGNNTVILDGDTTPSTSDYTHFGGVASSFARTFTIENTGTAALTISSIAVSGTHAAQFVVSGAPSSIAAGASATFTVTFSPGSGTGARTATVTINNNDSNEGAYDFALEGTAAVGSNITATYSGANDVPVSGTSFTATGLTANLTLNFAPAVGTDLMVVRNTGLAFINGRFSNLAHGQFVNLSFGGNTYQFVANYYGGTGNDLVLQWAHRSVFGWGGNSFGQLGNSDLTNRLTPVPVSSLGALQGKTILSIANGALHTLALCSDGTVVSWGYNNFGQLGNPSAPGGPTPVAVSTAGALAGKTVVAIAAGSQFSLALCSDGAVVSWGFNGNGQLGTGNTTASNVPVAVTTSTGALAGKSVVAIAAGPANSMALASDGTIASWGNNNGQYGSGSYSQSSIPVAPITTGILAGKTVTAIAAGYTHMLALCSDGSIVASGINNDGQLGTGDGLSTTSPVLVDTSGVLAGKTVVAVSAGYLHSMALTSDGTIVAWGRNLEGQLGDGDTTSASVPVTVTTSGVLAGLTPVAIDGGELHSLALCTDGSMVAFGSNSNGQLGDNSTVSSATPIRVDTSSLPPGSRAVATAAALSGFSVALVATPPPPPTVTSISPASGSTYGGTTVIINGANFDDATAVTFGGTPATSFFVQSSTRIVAVTPAAAEGSASVLVTTPGGTNAANSLYTYRGLPNVTSFTPNHGTIYGGTSVTITGTNFYDLDGVTFGGVPATIVSATPTSITVVTPAHAAGVVFMSVGTAYGSHTLYFTYAVPAPGEVDPLNASIIGSIVLSTAVQTDGSTLVAGNFNQVLGVGRNHLARILADGTLDSAFNPNPNGPVTSVAVQPDGKILLGGQFTTLQPNGAASPTTRNRIARLNTDGSLDPSFDPNANALVQCVVPLGDGRILVGGAFNTLQPNGAASPTTRNRVARLLADGTLDTTFDPNANDEVLSLALQGDGRVLLAGRFTTLQPNGAASATARNRVARLNADGTLDAAFDPNANGVVNALAVQADERVLLGGAFGTLQPNGAASATARTNFARVLANGSLDTSFDPRPNGAVNTLALQADGRILIGGAFTTLDPDGATATTRNRVARVNGDGSLDTGFDPAANNTVFSIALRADGSVLLGGFFTELQPSGATTPVARDYFVRLANDAATQSLSAVDSSYVYWSRGGSAPDLTGAQFEVSTDSGATWTVLPGTATRAGISADWELARTDLPISGLLRARGRTAGGNQSAGAGLVEFQATYSTPLAPPAVTAVAPSVGTTLGGDTVTITGNRFTGASAVTIGGTAATSVTVVNASTITAVTPAGAAGTASVRVTAPSGTSAGNTLFTYVTPPTVTAITPALGSTLGGGIVVITGTRFTNASAVSVGGTPVTSFVVNSDMQITAVTPVGTAGTARVTVTVPGATSAPNTLYTYISPPTLTNLSPVTGSTIGGQTVTLTGTNLSLASSVTFGGVSAASFTVNSATQITATAPALSAGQVGVVVTTPGGSATAATLFTAVAPPGVTSVAPALGTTLGGNTITVTGAGFSGATAVTVGGNAATGLTVVNGTTLTATTPAGVAGTASVVVVGPYGTSAANSLFTYIAPPTLTSVSPATGSTIGGQVVTLTGTNFSPATGVSFGGVSAASFTVNSATQITAVTPATTAGAKSVIVTTPGGSNGANTLFTTSVPTTTTTLASSQNPSIFLAQPTFTAQAVSAQAGLTGQMAFFVDNVLVETKAVDANGSATFTPAPAIFGAGNRVVRAAFDGGAFFAASSATLTQVVNKAPVVITLGALSQTYNGTARSATATNDVPSGYTVTVTFTYDGSSTAPVNAGTYTVAATITHANFQGSKTGQLVIAQAPLTFTVASTPLVYNGTPRAPSLTFSPTGVPTTVTYQSVVGGVPTGSASSTAPTQAGRYQGNVSTSNPNYSLPVATFQFDVLKANAALTFTNTEQTYDGTPRAPIVYSDPLNIPLTLTYQPLVNGVPTGSVSSQAPVAVGQYQVAATSTNHQLTPSTAVLRVGKRPVTISITRLSASFDGQPKPVGVATNPSGIPVTVTYTANGTTTTTAPSAPPAGGQSWRVDVVPADPTTYSGSATGLLRIETRRQPTLALTGPALSTPSSSGSFVATLGNLSTPRPTGTVYYRTLDGYGLFNGTVGADGKAVMTRTDFFLSARATPYEMVAEYSGDANYLPAVSNVHVNRIEKDVKLYFEYPGNLEYTGQPAVIPPSRLAFLYFNPSLVKSYQITYNGSTTLPTNPTTSPARIEIRYTTWFRDTDYLDVINLNILPAYARVKVGNLRQAYSSGGNPVQVTTDPAGLATRVTYNGAVLPNGPTTPGTYQVAATLVDTNFRLYNAAEASGTLVITQDTARFNVTNLTQNYDGLPKPVSVSATPSIPYVVLYDGSTRAPTAPGTYTVRVYPENSVYGAGSNHTLVIKARVSATVNGQADSTRLRLQAVSGTLFTSFPAYLSPAQNEWTLEFVSAGDLKFVKWSDGVKDNPRRITLGGASDPASYTFNAEAGQRYFLKAQTVKTGLPAGADGAGLGEGYYAVGQLARFEAGTNGDAIINRWEYNGKVLSPTDGHIILRDGREVYIKVSANGGNPVCHFTAGYIAEGFANGGNGSPSGTVDIKRLDYPNLPVLSQRFMPNGVNYVATAKPTSGFIFQGWLGSSSSQFTDTLKNLGYAVPGITEEFRRVGTGRYSSVFPNFIKDGPEFAITVSNQKRKASAAANGVDIAGIRTADVRITNNGKTATGVNLKKMKVTAFRVKRPNTTTWQYYYLNATGGEIDDNNRSNLSSGEKQLLFINQPVAINGELLNIFNPLAALDSLVADNGNPVTLDYPLGSIGYGSSQTVSILLGGSGQDVNFGLRAEIEVRMLFTVETNQGTQEVKAWWTDLNPM